MRVSSCPLTLIPTLINPGYVYSDNYTWLATSPVAWRQVSYNLSIITSCIPSMKAVLDAFSGNTLTVAIDASYELTSEIRRDSFQLNSQVRPESNTRLSFPSFSGFQRNSTRNGKKNVQSESVQSLHNDFIPLGGDTEECLNADVSIHQAS